ncbi:MAG TPA: beta-ketoacyl synthase N-terminal-like domain-containing protein [Polyangiaceae bacterium]|nr:beta-ketoacyl synthase N-terminal-like domain-containing protein [Polyangiaceae bacterium]
MRPVSVLASAAISALGRGTRAAHVGEIGEEPPTAVRLEPAGALARIDDAWLDVGEGDRAERLLSSAARDLGRRLDELAPDFRARRLFVCVGTSAGAMHSMQAAFASLEGAPQSLARRANYFAPLDGLFSSLGLSRASVKCVQPLGACSSSTLAIGLACRALEAGDCDLAIAGGYDALSDFVISGFAALGALSLRGPAPFRVERDGLALGEGAALIALVRAPEEARAPCILGFGASADAVHITAPDRDGRGLARAAERALLDAGIVAREVDLVSAHGTATPYNDSAESKALAQLRSEQRAVVHPWKASIGHTLGAAGALEVLAAFDALTRGVLPGARGAGEKEPELAGELLETNSAGAPRVALKLSAAFGGLNAALVLGAAGLQSPGSALAFRPVELAALGESVTTGEPELVASLAPNARDLAARADSLSELVLAAVARLVRSLGAPLPESCAVIVGTGVATLEANERFDQRRRADLPVLPRAFPPTSPNLCAGICSIAWGLRGPAFSVGASLMGAGREAFDVAELLVAAGDAEAALVVLAEDAGPVVERLFRCAGEPVPSRRARAALLVPGVVGNGGSEPNRHRDSAARWAELAAAAP